MTAFVERLRHFAYTGQILDEKTMEDVLKEVVRYVNSTYHGLVLVEVLGAGLNDTTTMLFTVSNGGNVVRHRWQAALKRGDQYEGQVSFAFDRRQKLWIMARDNKELWREDAVYEDHWGNVQLRDLPRFKALDYDEARRVKTSIMLPLHVDDPDGFVGLVNFEFVTDVSPTTAAKCEFEGIAAALAQLSLLYRIYRHRRMGTQRALKDLGDVAVVGREAEHRAHLVVMATTNDEFVQLLRAFGTDADSGAPNANGHYSVERSGKEVILAHSAQMGMPAAAATAMELIHTYRPKYLAMSGIMAGVPPFVALGDIVVADPSYDYGSGKIVDAEGSAMTAFPAEPEMRQERMDEQLRGKIANALARSRLFRDRIGKEAFPDTYGESGNLRIHVGIVASGAAVIEAPTVIEMIKGQDRKLLGVEMEIYGVMYAANRCAKPRPAVVCAKTVSDFANADRDRGFQPRAAFLSAVFIRELFFGSH